jgi:hypothetical protein
MTLESSLLSAVPGLRHAFFSREGGVSEGIYAGLNRRMWRKTAGGWPQRCTSRSSVF